MKKLVGLLFVVLMLVGCSNIVSNSLETNTLTEFYEKDLQNVSKVVIVDGSTGYKKTIDENVVIEGFLDEIKDIKFIPEENQEGRVGWRYSITLSQDDEYTFMFGLTQVNDNYYFTEPHIHPIVDKFYKTVDVQEE
ncbi:MAG: hypothetical protein ACK4M9_03500 [Anaerobacillus sp.]|uniref:hypothetical protein n=1 Tax=Anaerobacillus sp. TaxID=1872506 RepID=UPI00391A7C72